MNTCARCIYYYGCGCYHNHSDPVAVSPDRPGCNNFIWSSRDSSNDPEGLVFNTVAMGNLAKMAIEAVDKMYAGIKNNEPWAIDLKKELDAAKTPEFMKMFDRVIERGVADGIFNITTMPDGEKIIAMTPIQTEFKLI